MWSYSSSWPYRSSLLSSISSSSSSSNKHLYSALLSFSTKFERNVISNNVSISSAKRSTLYSASSCSDASKYVPGCVKPRSSRQICSISGFSYLPHTTHRHTHVVIVSAVVVRDDRPSGLPPLPPRRIAYR